MGATSIPDPLVTAHLEIAGRWCPGFHCLGHAADNLTAGSGRVLCGECSAFHIAWDQRARHNRGPIEGGGRAPRPTTPPPTPPSSSP